MKLQVVASPDEFAGMKTAWNSLLQESSSPSIVQTWEWMRTWWDVYGEDKQLRILCAFSGAELVAIAPFAIDRTKSRRLKILPYKSMWLLGSGRTAGRGVVSDYLDIIVRKGFEEEFVDNILSFLCESDEWEEINLANVDERSVVLKEMSRSCSRHGFAFAITNRAPSLLIMLPHSWDEFLASIAGSLRYKINRGRREFAAAGGEYRQVKDRFELPEIFAELERLHQERWRSKGKAGAFSCERWKSFHRKLLPLVLENGWLRMPYLTLAGKVVAVNYNFAFGRKIHFFQSGALPHENKHIRPGFLLHSFCIEEAIRDGFAEYDFLKAAAGGAGYKELWANHSRDLVDVRIAKNSLKEKVFCFLTKAAAGAKQAGNRFTAAGPGQAVSCTCLRTSAISQNRSLYDLDGREILLG